MMKKTEILKELLCVAIVIVAALSTVPAVHAAEGINPLEDFKDIMKKTDLPGFDSKPHDLSSVEPGASIITSVVFTALDFLKYVIGSIAVIYIIVSGIKLITAGKKIDEASEKEKDSLKLILYGFALIIIADELVSKVFFGDYGECIASRSNAIECAKAGSTLVQGLYGLVLAVMASVAIFMIALSAFEIIAAYGTEEEITKQKNRILMSIVGLLLAGVGEFVVKKIIFPDGGTKPLDLEAARKFVYNFTSFVAAFIAVSSFVMMFYGGYLYVVSAGNEEQSGKGKKIIISALIGIAIALAAYGIVATVISIGGSSAEVNLPQKIPGV